MLPRAEREEIVGAVSTELGQVLHEEDPVFSYALANRAVLMRTVAAICESVGPEFGRLLDRTEMRLEDREQELVSIIEREADASEKRSAELSKTVSGVAGVLGTVERELGTRVAEAIVDEQEKLIKAALFAEAKLVKAGKYVAVAVVGTGAIQVALAWVLWARIGGG